MNLSIDVTFHFGTVKSVTWHPFPVAMIESVCWHSFCFPYGKIWMLHPIPFCMIKIWMWAFLFLPVYMIQQECWHVDLLYKFWMRASLLLCMIYMIKYDCYDKTWLPFTVHFLPVCNKSWILKLIVFYVVKPGCWHNFFILSNKTWTFSSCLITSSCRSYYSFLI